MFELLEAPRKRISKNPDVCPNKITDTIREEECFLSLLFCSHSGVIKTFLSVNRNIMNLAFVPKQSAVVESASAASGIENLLLSSFYTTKTTRMINYSDDSKVFNPESR